MITRIFEFLSRGIWQIQIDRLPRRDFFFIRILRIFVLSIKEFNTDQCSLRASALTLYTLFSIVPFFAIAFGVASGFGLEQAFERKLLEISSQETVMTQIVEFARNLLRNTQGEWIAGIGVVFLLWSVIKVLGNIEQAFNDIWGVHKSRSWARKFSDYFSLIFIAPILFILASSITVFISSGIQHIQTQYHVIKFLNPAFIVILFSLPYLIIWFLLAFLYIFMPNTKVKVSAALVGGIIAGTIFQLAQWGYIHFQIGIANYNAIYGSFAAFPLFLVWLQLSWIVVLYGAEIAFAYQNEATYEFEDECEMASRHYQKMVALLLAAHVSREFQSSKLPPTAMVLSKRLELPIRLVRKVLDQLVAANILSTVHREDMNEEAYQPGRPLEVMTVKNVIELIERAGIDSLPISETAEMEKTRILVDQFWNRLERVPENIKLIDFFEFRNDHLQGGIGTPIKELA